MSPSKAVIKAKSAHRSFRLVVEPGNGDGFGVRVEETNGNPDRVLAVACPDSPQPAHPAYRPAHQPAILTANRKAPVLLDESAGVRFALAARAVDQINRSSRAHSILEGLASMSDEETLYWWAKVNTPTSGIRALRALRILLADDGRTGITS